MGSYCRLITKYQFEAEIHKMITILRIASKQTDYVHSMYYIEKVV